MSKALLNKILNNKKKPIKLIGRIQSSPNPLQYVVTTRSGKVRVEAPTPYKVGDKVVIYDQIIQGYAGDDSTPVVSMV